MRLAQPVLSVDVDAKPSNAPPTLICLEVGIQLALGAEILGNICGIDFAGPVGAACWGNVPLLYPCSRVIAATRVQDGADGGQPDSTVMHSPVRKRDFSMAGPMIVSILEISA